MIGIQPFTHFLAGFEIGHALRADRHLLAGARVASGSCVAGAGGEGTKAAQFDATARSQSIDNLLEEEIDDSLDFRERQARIFVSQFLDQFRTDHRISRAP